MKMRFSSAKDAFIPPTTPHWLMSHCYEHELIDQGEGFTSFQALIAYYRLKKEIEMTWKEHGSILNAWRIILAVKDILKCLKNNTISQEHQKKYKHHYILK